MPGLRIAVVDGASFVLPYDHGLVDGLAALGHRVSFFASRSRYNPEFLDALRARAGVRVVDAAVSGSVAPRWRGVAAYLGLWWTLWRRRAAFDAVNLQFSVLWPLELPFLWLLRRRLVFTVHNAVPHGHSGRTHAPTRWIARLARRLVFVSESTRLEFLRRYGAGFAGKSVLLPHGLLPLRPGAAPVPYANAVPQAQALVFWSTVKPYKGVELFAELARSADWQARGLPLEVWGRWDAAMAPLREELQALGVRVEDRYLDAAELQALFARPVVFVLPYHQASQSGALYTLLAQGCVFLCSDSGDLGDFLRSEGLPGLLLKDRSVGAVFAALDHLSRHRAETAQSLAAAQRRRAWPQVLQRADAAYALGTGQSAP
jgi:glycosyltransferase involved in cell wall biosynthesis